MSEGHVTVDAIEEDCVLVGVISQQVSEETAIEYLDELEFLALTAGAITKNRFLQKLPLPNPKTFVGSGKLEEIKEYIEKNYILLYIKNNITILKTVESNDLGIIKLFCYF